jgi:hypothetical protein
VGNSLKGAVDFVKPLAQGAVAEITSKLFGDETGKLYNKIKGVDQQIANIRAGVERAINNQASVYKRLLDDFVNGLGQAGNFVVGALMGEFNDNPSIWQTLLDSAIGMIPIVGEIGDVRDLIAYTKKFIEKPEEMQDPWNWVGVAGSLIGLYPVVGGAIKGVTKIARNADFVKDINKLGPTVVKAIVDFTKKSWDEAVQKSPKFFDKILDTIQGLVGMVVEGIRRGKEVWYSLKQSTANNIDQIQGFLSKQAENLEKLKDVATTEIKKSFDWLKNKLDELTPSFSRTNPSKPQGGTPRGTKTNIPANQKDPSAIRSLVRENESAETLAHAGYDVDQNPPKLPNGKDPDYRIEGQVFDCYSPSGSNPRNIASEIEGKIVSGQTERIILNLDDSSLSLDALRKQLTDYPISGLQEIIVVKGGNVEPFFPW